jgi:hypothetical protein
MQLDARGAPLHTRALTVALAARADGKLDLAASVLDLRKRGFVPVAGDLQASGIIHDMRLTGIIDPAGPVLERVAADQRSIAFEACPSTGGESCRDPIERVRALSGTPFDADFGRRLGAEIGGPRGCSHLLTLAHLVGSTTTWALGRERVLLAPAPARAAGQRVFRRDLVVDGQQPAAGRLLLVAQLSDLHFAPAPALARPMDRFGEAFEVRLEAEVDLRTYAFVRVEAAERRRDPAHLEQVPWRARDTVTRDLVGLRLGAGITAELRTRLGSAPDDRPLLDVLLMLAPTLVQCSAALSDTWVAAASSSPSFVGLGGLPDSCYMWRRDGVLARTRAAEGGGS